jgi:trigger factor
MQVNIKKFPNSEVEITGEIPADGFEAERKKALEKLGKDIKLNGFRPGKVPEDILAEKIGEDAVLEQMAEFALQKAYPKILSENKIDAIGRPEVSITKIAKGNPLGFKIRVTVLPEVKLPDWKAIAKTVMEAAKKEEIKVDDKDIGEAIDHLRKTRAKTSDVEERSGGASDVAKKEVLPELTDEFVKSIGKFESVEDFKNKIRENIKMEKELKARERNRMRVLEKIIEKAQMEIPEILIESEKGKMLAEMKANIAQMGMKWEDYMAHLKKTEDELKKAWGADAKKRVSQGLVINRIIAVEKIKTTEEELKNETEKILSYYKTQGQDLDEERVKNYANSLLLNEKVFQMFENTVE